MQDLVNFSQPNSSPEFHLFWLRFQDLTIVGLVIILLSDSQGDNHIAQSLFLACFKSSTSLQIPS